MTRYSNENNQSSKNNKILYTYISKKEVENNDLLMTDQKPVKL